MKRTAGPARGPIARKVLGEFEKIMARKVVPVREILAGRRRAEDLQKTVASRDDLAGLHPAHALYAYAQNQTSILSEQLTGLRPMKPFVDIVGKAEDDYMPSGPPMSPLTRSYFTCWALFDACVGAARETIGTCIVDIAPTIGVQPDLLRLIATLQDSRMGLHLVRRHSGPVAELRELVTGVECEAIVPSGHRGQEGEVWLVRILAPAFAGAPHVAFTTPYLIIGPGLDAWEAYFRRTLPSVGAGDERLAYEILMKYGPERRYWPEYVFEAYVNHRAEVIFLHGLPDVAESRPHSRESEERREAQGTDPEYRVGPIGPGAS